MRHLGYVEGFVHISITSITIYYIYIHVTYIYNHIYIIHTCTVYTHTHPIIPFGNKTWQWTILATSDSRKVFACASDPPHEA